MLENFTLITFYFFLLIPFAGVRKHSIVFYVLIPLIFIVKIFIANIILDNNIEALVNIRPYSMYDSAEYFYNVKSLSERSYFEIFPDLPSDTADILYLTLIYWIAYVYKNLFFIGNIQFIHIALFNVFLSTINYLIIYNFLSRRKAMHEYMLIVLMLVFGFFETSMIAFSSVIERELVVGLLLTLGIIFYIDRRWIFLTVVIILVILTRYAYLFIFLAFLIALLIYKSLRNVGVSIFFSLTIIISFIISGFWLLEFLDNPMLEYIFRHNIEDNGSGFGSYISNLNIPLSVLTYSFVGVVSPIPFYPFYDERLSGFYLFGLLQGLGAVNFLVLLSIILNNVFNTGFKKSYQSQLFAASAGGIRNISQQLEYCVLFIILCLIVFQGISFNIRHKVQLMPILLLIAVLSIGNRALSNLSISKVLTRCIYFSIAVIVFLNCIYFYAKLQ